MCCVGLCVVCLFVVCVIVCCLSVRLRVSLNVILCACGCDVCPYVSMFVIEWCVCLSVFASVSQSFGVFVWCVCVSVCVGGVFVCVTLCEIECCEFLMCVIVCV